MRDTVLRTSTVGSYSKNTGIVVFKQFVLFCNMWYSSIAITSCLKYICCSYTLHLQLYLYVLDCGKYYNDDENWKVGNCKKVVNYTHLFLFLISFFSISFCISRSLFLFLQLSLYISLFINLCFFISLFLYISLTLVALCMPLSLLLSFFLSSPSFPSLPLPFSIILCVIVNFFLQRTEDIQNCKSAITDWHSVAKQPG